CCAYTTNSTFIF
nr:immunoglobulin light chain junction region [Macaca mulatta]